jgi:hypothetical protein
MAPAVDRLAVEWAGSRHIDPGEARCRVAKDPPLRLSKYEQASGYRSTGGDVPYYPADCSLPMHFRALLLWLPLLLIAAPVGAQERKERKETTVPIVMELTGMR